MISDYHMHTLFSSDSETKVKKMIDRAIELGMEEICITDHQDADFPEKDFDFYLDTDKYFETLLGYKKKYKNFIDLYIGVELGMQPHLGERYEKYMQRYPFDFVIASQHLVYGRDPYYPETLEAHTDEELYGDYFKELLENIKALPKFDVLGHLDYVVRYGRSKAENYSYEAYKDIIDEILKEIVQKGMGLEVNTAGLKYGLGFCHPHMDALKKYKELGGEIITVGADAHKPEHIGYCFEQAEKLLKEAGFRYYTVFKNREPVFKPL